MGGRGDGGFVLPRRGHRAPERPLPPPGRQPGAHRARGLTRPRRAARGERRAPPPRPPAGRGPAVARARAPATRRRSRCKLGLARGPGRASTTASYLSRVQRPGLALTGYTDYIRYGRVQIMGGSEVGYLRKLRPRRAAAILERLCRCRISCFVVTKGLAPPPELLSAAEARRHPRARPPRSSRRPSSSSSPPFSRSGWPRACTCTRCSWTCSAWACSSWGRAASASPSAPSTSSTAAIAWWPTTWSRSSA